MGMTTRISEGEGRRLSSAFAEWLELANHLLDRIETRQKTGVMSAHYDAEDDCIRICGIVGYATITRRGDRVRFENQAGVEVGKIDADRTTKARDVRFVGWRKSQRRRLTLEDNLDRLLDECGPDFFALFAACKSAMLLEDISRRWRGNQ